MKYLDLGAKREIRHLFWPVLVLVMLVRFNRESSANAFSILFEPLEPQRVKAIFKGLFYGKQKQEETAPTRLMKSNMEPKRFPIDSPMKSCITG